MANEAPNTISKPFQQGVEYKVRLGASISQDSNSSHIHVLRYDFKPASIQSKQTAKLNIHDSALHIRFPQQDLSFNGKYERENSNETQCILVFDPHTQSFILERVTGIVALQKQKFTQPEGASAGASGRLSMQPTFGKPTLVRPDEEITIANKKVSPEKQQAGSNSSSGVSAPVSLSSSSSTYKQQSGSNGLPNLSDKNTPLQSATSLSSQQPLHHHHQQQPLESNNSTGSNNKKRAAVAAQGLSIQTVPSPRKRAAQLEAPMALSGESAPQAYNSDDEEEEDDTMDDDDDDLSSATTPHSNHDASFYQTASANPMGGTSAPIPLSHVAPPVNLKSVSSSSAMAPPNGRHQQQLHTVVHPAVASKRPTGAAQVPSSQAQQQEGDDDDDDDDDDSSDGSKDSSSDSDQEDHM